MRTAHDAAGGSCPRIGTFPAVNSFSPSHECEGALRGRLLDANTNEVPGIVQDMAPYRRGSIRSCSTPRPRPRRTTTAASNCTPASPFCQWTPAAVEMEAGGMAETGERGLGEGPGEAGQAVGEDSGTASNYRSRIWATLRSRI